mgnify:FL=1
MMQSCDGARGKIVRTWHVSRDSSQIMSGVTINTIIEFITLCNTAAWWWVVIGSSGHMRRGRKPPPGSHCPGQSWHYWWSLDTWWSLSSYPIMVGVMGSPVCCDPDHVLSSNIHPERPIIKTLCVSHWSPCCSWYQINHQISRPGQPVTARWESG